MASHARIVSLIHHFSLKATVHRRIHLHVSVDGHWGHVSSALVIGVVLPPRFHLLLIFKLAGGSTLVFIGNRRAWLSTGPVSRLRLDVLNGKHDTHRTCRFPVCCWRLHRVEHLLVQWGRGFVWVG